MASRLVKYGGQGLKGIKGTAAVTRQLAVKAAKPTASTLRSTSRAGLKSALKTTVKVARAPKTVLTKAASSVHKRFKSLIPKSPLARTVLAGTAALAAVSIPLYFLFKSSDQGVDASDEAIRERCASPAQNVPNWDKATAEEKKLLEAWCNLDPEQRDAVRDKVAKDFVEEGYTAETLHSYGILDKDDYPDVYADVSANKFGEGKPWIERFWWIFLVMIIVLVLIVLLIAVVKKGKANKAATGSYFGSGSFFGSGYSRSFWDNLIHQFTNSHYLSY